MSKPRYFAIVRRARPVMPASASFSLIWSSLRGFDLSSASIISCSLALIASQLFSFPCVSSMPPLKNFLKRQNTPRALHIFACDRTRDRGEMHADVLGNLRHRQWLQIKLALVEKFPLPIDNRAGNLEQRVFPLLYRVDYPLGRADVVLQELFCLFCRPCRRRPF